MRNVIQMCESDLLCGTEIALFETLDACVFDPIETPQHGKPESVLELGVCESALSRNRAGGELEVAGL